MPGAADRLVRADVTDARPKRARSGASASMSGMVVQLGFATSRTSSSTSAWFTPATTSGTFGIEAVGVALVDHAVAELEQARHVARAVIVVERDQREVAARRVGASSCRRAATA